MGVREPARERRRAHGHRGGAVPGARGQRDRLALGLGLGGGLGLRGGLGLGGSGARFGRGLVPERRDHRADRERLTGLRDDRQLSRGRRLVRHRRLVGLDLEQLVARLDLIAGRFEPGQDRAVLHRVRQARHRDLDRLAGHQIRSSAAPTIVLGIDRKVLIQIIDVARLPEVIDPQTRDRYVPDRAQERQRVRVPIQHAHDRRRSLHGEDPIEDPV